ncbi:MAG: nitronate monooxygenase [Patescibacteria group bacterium]
MFENNPLTRLLGIRYPIIQGGMAGISEANLVSAVSNAGGLGTLGSGLMSAQWLEKEIDKARQLTSKPFAVNLFLQNPRVEKLVRLIIRKQVPIVFTGGGNPLTLFSYFQSAGTKVIPVVPSSRLAKKMEDNGADAVVVEGLEAGGHIGDNTTFCVIPQTRALVKKIPIIAAGGIWDGKTVAAALLLGADGVQMGTRFLASKECKISEDYKKKIIEAGADDVEVVLRWTRHPIRVIKNQLSEEWKKLEERGAFPEEIKAQRIAGSLGGSDINKIPLMAGFSAAGISNIETCQEMIDKIISDARKTLSRGDERLD